MIRQWLVRVVALLFAAAAMLSLQACAGEPPGASASAAGQVPPPGELIRHSYDIRDLMPPSPPRLVTSQSTGGLFRTPATTPSDAGRAQVVVDLMKLLQDTISRADWPPGTAIHERDGFLTVVTTERAHTAIDGLFQQLRETRILLVTLEMRLVAVPPAMLQELRDRRSTEPDHVGVLLEQSQVQELLRAFPSSPTEASIPPLAVFQHQDASIDMGIDQTYVSGWSVPAGDGGENALEPRTTTIRTGLLLRFQTRIADDRRYIRLALDCSLSHLRGMRKVPLKPAGARQWVFVEAPMVYTRQLKATILVPDGGTMLIGPLEDIPGEPSGAALNDEQVPLCLMVTASMPFHADRQRPLWFPGAWPGY